MIWLAVALADPCGMVIPPPPPELKSAGGTTLRRDGAQRTYVAFERGPGGQGIETMALRPGFVGEVDEFGMLIPFPTPPTIRKVDENLFSHIEAAVDPPPMVVDVVYPTIGRVGGLISAKGAGGLSSTGTKGTGGGGAVEPALGYYEVAVLREQAVGMYEVAVLQAGSPEALERWMTENGFVYPEGMEEPVWAYVEARWCFVAIKARVGAGAAAEPFPGMREADTTRPPGSTFDGFVQAMGFRFETDEPVLPMRLSVHNPTDEPPRNVVYMLTDEPVAIRDLDHELVVRQVGGDELLGHLRDPLPLWFRTGRAEDVSPWVFDEFAHQRHPQRFNGLAGELFASDLAAFQTGSLELGFEVEHTELLNISESLNLRGPEVDDRLTEAVKQHRQEVVGEALESLAGMTLTVLDGVFDVEVLARQNLGFEPYTLPLERNGFRVEALKPASPVISVPAGIRSPRPTPAPTPARSGVVTLTKLLVVGDREESDVRALLTRYNNQFTNCYQRELFRDPTQMGTLQWKFSVEPEGSVNSAAVGSSDLAPAVGACVTSRVLRIPFPPSEALNLVKVWMKLDPG